MLRLSLAALVIASASCGGGSVDSLDGGPDTPSVAAATPDYAPMRGGTRVLITGDGFLHGNAPPNRVLIGGIEASAAGVIDDNTIEVVVPPSDVPGDVEIVVFNRNGRASAAGIFHYSTPPTITDVTPATADIEGGDMITIHGAGFIDEAAGPLTITMNGERVYDVEVPNDGTAIFPAPPGIILSRPDIVVDNLRGEATQNQAFQYVVNGSTAGLIAFPSFTTDDVFAYFIDTVDGVAYPIPRSSTTPNPPSFTSSARDSSGNVYVVNRNDQTLNRLDIETQQITRIGPVGAALPGMAFRGEVLHGARRCSTFGTVNTETGTFTATAAATLNSCQNALAVDGAGTVYAITSNTTAITTVNPATAAIGTPVAFAPVLAPFHISGMTFHGGVLYATASNQSTQASKIITINPATGAVADVISLPTKVSDLLEMP